MEVGSAPTATASNIGKRKPIWYTVILIADAVPKNTQKKEKDDGR